MAVQRTEQLAYEKNPPPLIKLNTKRSLFKYIIFSILTLGIYQLVFFSVISQNINDIASCYDGKKTMHFCLLSFIVAPVTLGIAKLVWFHRLSTVSAANSGAGKSVTASAQGISGSGLY